MKQLFTFFILSFTLFLFPNSIYASHIAGGGLFYRTIENETYEIILILQRDCVGASPEAEFDDPASIGIFDSEGKILRELGTFGSISMPFNSLSTSRKTVEFCTFIGGDICIETTHYKGRIKLPFKRGGYQLAYQRCCRPENITNIETPGLVGATYKLHITEDALRLNNSGPKLNQLPQIYYCDKSLDIDFDIRDNDQDELMFEFKAAFKGADTANAKPVTPKWPLTPIVYKPNFSPANFMNTSKGFTIHPNNGKILGDKTDIEGQYLCGIVVKEFRSGILLSESNLDFIIYARNCKPSISLRNETKIIDDNGSQSGEINPVFTNPTIIKNYKWSNDDTTSSIRNLLAGKYFLTITDTFGCEYSFSFEVKKTSSLFTDVKKEIDIRHNSQTIWIHNPNQELIHFEIINLNGKVILNQSTKELNAELYLDNFPKGLFVLCIQNQRQEKRSYKIFNLF